MDSASLVALAIARNWDETAAVLEDVRSGENRLFRVQLRGEHFALRLTPESHRGPSLIEGELAFIDYLSMAGLWVARALPLPNGQRVLVVPPGRLTSERAHATMFRWLPGRHFAFHSTDIERPLFRRWGAAMARLHAIAQTFKAPPDAQRAHWFDDPLAGCASGDIAVTPALAALRHDLLTWLRGMPPDPTQYGMVHGDFERTNFVLHGDELGIIDFDDCCVHWYAWDIACALWVFRNESASNRSLFLSWFLEGYSSVRAVDTTRLEQFSELVRLRTLALILHRLRRPGGPASEADRNWVDRNAAWLLTPWRWDSR